MELAISLGTVRPLLQRHLLPLASEKNFQKTTTQVRYTSVFTTSINMSSFLPTNYDLRTALVFCYQLKKTAAESHRMLVEAYCEHALGKTQCFEWFKNSKVVILMWQTKIVENHRKTAFIGIRRVLSIINCWNQVKLSTRIATSSKWSI